MVWKVYDNTKQSYLEGEWNSWQEPIDFIIDNDPHLKYIYRDEMEDIVLARFTVFGGDELSLVEIIQLIHYNPPQPLQSNSFLEVV